ncbi:MAG: hypothetical protein ABIH34_00730 [Nanoarchaeota archaeon]
MTRIKQRKKSKKAWNPIRERGDSSQKRTWISGHNAQEDSDLITAKMDRFLLGHEIGNSIFGSTDAINLTPAGSTFLESENP